MNRLTWYCLSTPAATTRAANAIPATSSPLIHRRGTPATASTPKTVAVSTSMVPRSGWSMISAAGIPAIPSINQTSTPLMPRPREFSVRSATSMADIVTTASLANSAGWIDMPPSISQEREPLMVEPITSTRSRPKMLPM
jgi:hypothetical protein